MCLPMKELYRRFAHRGAFTRFTLKAGTGRVVISEAIDRQHLLVVWAPLYLSQRLAKDQCFAGQETMGLHGWRGEYIPIYL